MERFSNDNTLANSEEVSLKEVILKIKDLWNFLLNKWIIISIAIIIGCIIGFAYALLKKPIYKAELSFAVQDEKGSAGGFTGAIGLASQFGIDLGGGAGGEFSGENLLELMKSRNIIEKTLLTSVNIHGKTQTLAEYYISFNKLRDTWKDTPLQSIHYQAGVNRLKFTQAQDSLLGVFYKTLKENNVSVDKADKKLSIITITVTSTNELFSKNFAEELTKVVSDFYVQTKTKKEVQNVSILQRQTDSVRRSLYNAISGVASSSDASPNPNPALLSLRVPSQRKQVDVQANSVILNELVKNLEVSKMSLLQETPLIQIIDKPILPLTIEKPGKFKGFIIGGIVGFLMASMLLLISRFFKSVMN